MAAQGTADTPWTRKITIIIPATVATTHENDSAGLDADPLLSVGCRFARTAEASAAMAEIAEKMMSQRSAHCVPNWQ